MRPELPPFPTAGEAADVGRDVALRWLDALEAETASALAAESERQDREAYYAAEREWQAAADAFKAAAQRLAAGEVPADSTRTAIDAAALARLHERWLETAVHLASRSAAELRALIRSPRAGDPPWPTFRSRLRPRRDDHDAARQRAAVRRRRDRAARRRHRPRQRLSPPTCGPSSARSACTA
jgi:hypothetical protein